MSDNIQPISRPKRVCIMLEFACTQEIKAVLLAKTIQMLISEECDPDGDFILKSASFMRTLKPHKP